MGKWGSRDLSRASPKLISPWTQKKRHSFLKKTSQPFTRDVTLSINKRPKGPHIMHLSTMCHLFDGLARAASYFSDQPKKHKLGRGRWDLSSCQVFIAGRSAVSEEKSKIYKPIRGQGGHLVFSIGSKYTNLVKDIEILLPVIEFRSAVSEEKSKMSQPIRSQGGHLFFPIGPKNTNLVEDVEILLPVKFCWIQFSGFREVENISANQRPGRPSCFSDRPEKHKLGRGHWDLASCQVLFHSVQQFQRWRRKCFSQSEARAAILFLRSNRKTQTR